jgi:hypothetical protein
MLNGWLSRRQAAWGGASSGGPNRLVLVAIGLVLVFIGGGIGYSMGGAGAADAPTGQAEPSAGSGQATSLPSEGAGPIDASGQPTDVENAVIVQAGVESIETAPPTRQGAAEAATAMATEFVYFSLEPRAGREAVVDIIVDPAASEDVRDQFLSLLENRRAELIGPPNAERQLTAKFVTVPASYQVQEVVPGERVNARVWMQTVLIDPTGQQVQSSWSTVAMELVWSDHWRVVAYARDPGPTPQLLSQGANYSPFDEVVTVFDDFYRYRYAVTQ